jgi:probable HAF family extracellular repeat protein
MKLKGIQSAIALAPICLIAFGNATAQLRYRISELPVVPAAINNLGQIAGSSEVAPNDIRAFVYSGGAMQDIGSLAGMGTFASDINDRGEVTGISVVRTSSQFSPFAFHAYIYSGGVMKDLGMVPGGRPESESRGYAINNRGEVAGAWGSPPVGGAFLYSGGVMQSIAPPPSDGACSQGGGINNSGEVVGSVGGCPAIGPYHAFVYRGGSTRLLGTLGGINSSASDINDKGDISGWAETVVGERHAFVYNNSIKDLGTLPGDTMSYGGRINAKGWVIGTSESLNSVRAFLYDGTAIHYLGDLLEGDDSGWIFDDVRGLNDEGQIVGYALFNGTRQGYLLTPIPEPSTYAMMLIGMLFIGSVCARIRKQEALPKVCLSSSLHGALVPWKGRTR